MLAARTSKCMLFKALQWGDSHNTCHILIYLHFLSERRHYNSFLVFTSSSDDHIEKFKLRLGCLLLKERENLNLPRLNLD